MRPSKRRIAQLLLALGALAIIAVAMLLLVLWIDTDIGMAILIPASVAALAGVSASAIYLALTLLAFRDASNERRIARNEGNTRGRMLIQVDKRLGVIDRSLSATTKQLGRVEKRGSWPTRSCMRHTAPRCAN